MTNATPDSPAELPWRLFSNPAIAEQHWGQITHRVAPLDAEDRHIALSRTIVQEKHDWGVLSMNGYREVHVRLRRQLTAVPVPEQWKQRWLSIFVSGFGSEVAEAVQQLVACGTPPSSHLAVLQVAEQAAVRPRHREKVAGLAAEAWLDLCDEVDAKLVAGMLRELVAALPPAPQIVPVGVGGTVPVPAAWRTRELLRNIQEDAQLRTADSIERTRKGLQ